MKILATQYVWLAFGKPRWRSSQTFESFLAEFVNRQHVLQGLQNHGPGTRYDDCLWKNAYYPHYYLGYYNPLYVASLQRALLRLSPVREFREFRVLDVGVGAGATPLAIADLLQTAAELGLRPLPRISITFIDSDKSKLAFARESLAAYVQKMHGTARRIAEEWLSEASWIQVDLADALDEMTGAQDYNLVVLGNVIRELGRAALVADGSASRARNNASVLPARCLGTSGYVLALEHGSQERGRESCKAVCTFLDECRNHGLRVLVPDEHSECIFNTMQPETDDCRCAHTFDFEWPPFLTSISGWPTKENDEPQDHRRVRSIWGVAVKAGPDSQSATPEPLVFSELDYEILDAHAVSVYRCPECGSSVRRCEADGNVFLGCARGSAECRSVTEMDGTVRIPEGRDEVTRNRKRQVVRQLVLQANEHADSIQALNFEFSPGKTYRNGRWEYLVLSVYQDKDERRLRARRLDTGAEIVLSAQIAATRHLQHAGEGEEP